MYNEACGGSGSLWKMDTCPTSFPKNKGDMSKIVSTKMHETHERGITCGKVEDYKVQKVSMVGKVPEVSAWS